jgi:hypothetical protein
MVKMKKMHQKMEIWKVSRQKNYQTLKTKKAWMKEEKKNLKERETLKGISISIKDLALKFLLTNPQWLPPAPQNINIHSLHNTNQMILKMS